MGAVNINVSNVNAQYNRQKPDVKINFSSLAFDKFIQSSGQVGKLIPVFWRELLPTQKINVNQQVALQFTPFVTNVYTPFEGRCMSYFVPSRLIWPDIWENFVITGQDGIQFNSNGDIQIDQPLPKLNADMFDPFFDETTGNLNYKDHDDKYNGETGLIHSLYDYFSLPIHTLPIGHAKNQLESFLKSFEDANLLPITALFRAYNLIWNDVLRFPDISVEKRDLDDMTCQSWYWANDYFTRSRVYQQRGDVPVIPLLSADGMRDEINVRFRSYVDASVPGVAQLNVLGEPASGAGSTLPAGAVSSPLSIYSSDTVGGTENYKDKGLYLNLFNSPFSDKPYAGFSASLDTGAGISLNDFCMALAIGNFEIDMAKVIPRYMNYIVDIWHGDSLDSRFQLPEFLGTWTFGVDFSSIIQQSGSKSSEVETGEITPLGHISSLASSVSKGNVTFTAPEHGYVITVMCIRPQATYEGGMPRFLIRNTPFDFATPHLVNVPDVQIDTTELVYSQSVIGQKFGWMGIYDEYRSETGCVTGLLRPSISDAISGLGSMTLARCFLDTPPALNEEFCLCRPDMARIKIYPNEPDFTFFFTSSVHTAIPLPFESNPTLLGTM